MQKLILHITHEKLGDMELEFYSLSDLIDFCKSAMKDEETTALILKGD